MTGTKRPQPLCKVHPGSTRAHGLHMHYFYHFDTATDLYLSGLQDTKETTRKRTKNTQIKEIYIYVILYIYISKNIIIYIMYIMIFLLLYNIYDTYI